MSHSFTQRISHAADHITPVAVPHENTPLQGLEIDQPHNVLNMGRQ